MLAIYVFYRNLTGMYPIKDKLYAMKWFDINRRRNRNPILRERLYFKLQRAHVIWIEKNRTPSMNLQTHKMQFQMFLRSKQRFC